jgi:hypothetical protein
MLDRIEDSIEELPPENEDNRSDDDKPGLWDALKDLK